MGSAGASEPCPGGCAAMGGRDLGGPVPVVTWSQQQEAGYGDSKGCLWAKQASTINITSKKKKPGGGKFLVTRFAFRRCCGKGAPG